MALNLETGGLEGKKKGFESDLGDEVNSKRDLHENRITVRLIPSRIVNLLSFKVTNSFMLSLWDFGLNLGFKRTK